VSAAGSLRRQQQEKAPGNLPSTVDSCRWSIDVEPAYGWGPQAGKQQSTAGWLAALPVFEPHWQVTPGMAYQARACSMQCTLLFLCSFSLRVAAAQRGSRCSTSSKT
jgi:Tocopherol cyclase